MLLPLLLPGPRTSAIDPGLVKSPAPGTSYGAKDWAVDFWKCDHRVLLTGFVELEQVGVVDGGGCGGGDSGGDGGGGGGGDGGGRGTRNWWMNWREEDFFAG